MPSGVGEPLEGESRPTLDDQGKGSVSVVIPCFNQAHYLGEAIESVLAQTLEGAELVVVDDGSADNSFEVAGRYPGLNRLRQENRGVAAARNAGLAASGGCYVVFLDADDRLMPDALELGTEMLATRPQAAFAAGMSRDIRGDGAPIESRLQPLVTADHYRRLLEGCFIWSGSSVVHRRTALEHIGGFDQSFSAADDYDLYLRIAREFPIHCHDSVVTEYRRHGSNTTRDPAVVLESELEVLDRQRPRLRNRREEKAGVRGCAGRGSATRCRSPGWEKPPDGGSAGDRAGEPLRSCAGGAARRLSRRAPARRRARRGERRRARLGAGGGKPAAAVEFSLDGESFWRAPVWLDRPDLAEAFPGRAGAERAGFATTLDLVGKRPELAVGVSVVLDDGNRVQLATIDARRSWRRERSPVFAQLVSVVVDCRSLADEQLQAAIEDVQGQSYPHLEIVLVGPGSGQVASDHPALRRAGGDDLEPAQARNLGIRSSNGDYLVFVDSAAAAGALPSGLVEAGVGALEESPACAAASEGSPSPAIYRRALFEHLRGFDPALGDTAAAEFDLALAHRFAVCAFDAAPPLRAGG